MRKFIKILLFLAVLLWPFVSFAQTGVPLDSSGKPASIFSEIEMQSEAFAGTQGANLGDANDPRIIIAQIIKIFLTIVGTLSLMYTIYGGFAIMTSGGQEEKITKGRRTVAYGAIGVLIILSAYSITFYVYSAIYRGIQNPFGSYFEWGVRPNQSNYRQTDPLEQNTIPEEFYPF